MVTPCFLLNSVQLIKGLRFVSGLAASREQKSPIQPLAASTSSTHFLVKAASCSGLFCSAWYLMFSTALVWRAQYFEYFLLVSTHS